MGSDSPARPTGAVDADLWGPQATGEDLAAHLPRGWRQLVAPEVEASANGFGEWLPSSLFWRPATTVATLAESPDPHAEVRRYLDRHALSHAVLNPGTAQRVSALANPQLAAAVAQAGNDWMVGLLGDADPRLFGSIVVSARDPAAAAAEIHRVAEHARMVQVQLAFPPARLGERRFDPIYAAATEHELAVQLVADGAYSGANRGVITPGHPATSPEYALETRLGAQPHLLSLIAGGAFQRHPGLRVVLSGFGVAWLAGFLWAADQSWHDGATDWRPRGDCPLPSQQVLDHVRLTTARAELSADPTRLRDLLALVPSGEHVLLYGSGYERRDDDLSTTAAFLPDAWHREVLASNAQRLFGLTTIEHVA
jgi:predicted TIM-barrel fold metal-dependent hydrolase